MTNMTVRPKVKSWASPRLLSPFSQLSFPFSAETVSVLDGSYDAGQLLLALLQNTSLTSLCIDSSMLAHGRDAVQVLSRALNQNDLLDNSSVALTERMWTFLPAHICSLLNLQHLDLSHNHLQALPWSILRLQLLETLNISNNSISGDALPVHLSFLPRLRGLDLSVNPVVAAFPTTVNWRNVNELLKVIFCPRAVVAIMAHALLVFPAVLRRVFHMPSNASYGTWRAKNWTNEFCSATGSNCSSRFLTKDRR